MIKEDKTGSSARSTCQSSRPSFDASAARLGQAKSGKINGKAKTWARLMNHDNWA